MKMMKKENLGCLLFYVLLGCVGIFSYLYVQNANTRYLVEETGYFHSTDDEEKCRFIKSANMHGYTIKKIDKEVPLRKGYKICKECFPQEKQDKYNKDLKWRKDFNQHLTENMEWSYLTYGVNYDFNKLVVYIDTKNILHIDGGCFSIDGKASRLPLSEIESIESTCEDCVGREYCDFIYKKIYEGVYDIKAIKDPEDDN